MELSESKATAEVLRSELEATRLNLSQREEECERLRRENEEIVLRLLEDKASVVAEMNKMNDEVERLTKQVN